MVAWLQKYGVRLLALLFVLLPATVAAESIDSFRAQYVINTDGSVSVTEYITYDFGTENKRGIFRIVETDHPQPASSWFKERAVEIAVMGVTRDGIAEQYVVSDNGGEVEVRIGDENVFITGAHYYEIAYLLRGALSYGADGAELYWNATGHNWPVAMRNVEVSVTALPGVLVPTQYACYVGAIGSKEQCAHTESRGATTTVFFAPILQSGEGLTIGQAVNTNTVATLVVEQWSLSVLGLIIVPPLLLLLIMFIYRRQTYYKPDAPIIAQYEPYQNLLPMYTGVIFDGRLDSYDIAAGIVYLAEQGFIKIKHTETKVLGIFTSGDYELTLLRPITEVADEAQRAILAMIFSAFEAGTRGLLVSIKNVFSPQPVPAMEVGKTVLLSELKQNAQANAQVISSLQTVFTQQLYKEGYYEKPLTIGFLSLGKAVSIGIVILGVVGVLTVLEGSFLPLFMIIPVFIGLTIVFAGRRTRKGYEARFHLLGFKEFLSVTDKERFAFHNAPEKNPELFMKYLPYAIAFKVEKEWAKVFEGITMPNPDWYESSTGMHAFSAAAFTSDISSFASSFNASSGTSGSSGGGSSGGGGGGGGGGSW